MSEDQVPRLERFKAEHPDIQIFPPYNLDPYWDAMKDGKRLASAIFLEKFLDKLDAIVSQVDQS